MADEGSGASITFGTSGTTINAISIQGSGIAREALETTHLQTTGGYKTYIPADYKDPGEISVTFRYDPDTQPPIAAAAETITITYPVPVGENNGATEASSGFVTSFDGPTLENDTVMDATMTIKRTGPITFTDAST